MILNNFPTEFKTLQKRSGKTQLEIAEKCGMRRENVARVARLTVITQKFVEVYEAMGYDLVISYVKRGEKDE